MIGGQADGDDVFEWHSGLCGEQQGEEEEDVEGEVVESAVEAVGEVGEVE